MVIELVGQDEKIAPFMNKLIKSWGLMLLLNLMLSLIVTKVLSTHQE